MFEQSLQLIYGTLYLLVLSIQFMWRLVYFWCSVGEYTSKIRCFSMSLEEILHTVSGITLIYSDFLIQVCSK